MRSVRLLTLAAIFLPTLAQAQVYSTYYGAPTTGITRAAFVQMVMSRIGAVQGGTNCFKDVTTQAFAPVICGAKARGIVTGDPTAKFRPNDAITFVEAAAVAIRAEGTAGLSYDNPWYRPYLTTLANWNAFPRSVGNILYPISATQAQDLIANVFTSDHNSNGNNGPVITGNNGSSSDDNNNDDVAISVSASDSSPQIDDVITYTIKISNDTDHDLNNVDVRAYIDSKLDYVSSTDGGEYERDRIDWNNLDINEGDTESITLKLRVAQSAEDGDDLSVRVNADDSDVRTTVTVDDNGHHNRSSNDFTVSVTGSSNSVDTGDTVTYRINLTNDTNDDVTTDVRAMLDNDMLFVSASTGGDENNDEVMWDNVFIPEGGERTLTVKVRIADSAFDGSVRLDVRADGESDSVTTDVNGNNNFHGSDFVNLSVSDSPDPAQVGDIVTYTIRLENTDNNDSTVDVSTQLDSGMSFYSASSGGYRDGNEVRWDNVDINGNDTRTLTLRVRINSDAFDGESLRLDVRAGDVNEKETTNIQN